MLVTRMVVVLVECETKNDDTSEHTSSSERLCVERVVVVVVALAFRHPDATFYTRPTTLTNTSARNNLLFGRPNQPTTGQKIVRKTQQSDETD